METPLDQLLRRREDWLVGYGTQPLVELARQRHRELTQYKTSPTVFLSESDPIRFLSSFIAACSANCQIFLCNPAWVEAEWRQVFEWVQPDLVWGDVITPDTFANITHSPLTKPDGNLIMIPTGGTSGKIRFAMHTWETLTASVQGFREHFAVDRVHSFCVLPLYHVSGLMQFMRSFISEGRFVTLPWKTIETEGTIAEHSSQGMNPEDFFLSLVPTQLQRLLSQPNVPDRWLSRFRAILLGGAPAWSSLLEAARSYSLPLAPTYGMTETASQIATLHPEDFLRGDSSGNLLCDCSGKTLPHARITLQNAIGEQLEAGQTGRITIQADSLMLGYYPNLLNGTTYQPDDVGFFDAQNYLHIVGRNSSKIITGGENVFPAEVEAAILATKLVKDVCVVGTPDSTWGQIVTAVYVPEPTASWDTLTIALERTLSKVKRPKRWVAIDRLPRNLQGKINREQLSKKLNAEP